MPNQISPRVILEAIAELRRQADEVARCFLSSADSAFAWADRNGGFPNSAEGRERFVEETGLVAQYGPDGKGFEQRMTQAMGVGRKLRELADVAVAVGCDDATAAALVGASALMLDVCAGRIRLSKPDSWTDARLQTNQITQSETVGGVPILDAGVVALMKLERRLKEMLTPAERPATVALSPSSAPATWNTVKDASLISGLSKGRISQLCNKGVLDSIGAGPSRRVNPASLTAYILKRDASRNASDRESDEEVQRKMDRAERDLGDGRRR